ncbi:MAG: class I SAM-dependent methyltransferase [bacterium]|nr:class I SAM-dependent methyltransferase [bacterium]
MTTIDLLYSQNWKEYALLDSGEGERLEQFGRYLFRRPDPQVLWKKTLTEQDWNKADATFTRLQEDRGEWSYRTKVMPRWQLGYEDLILWVEPTPFKHLGVFPEQAVHWDWMREQIEKRVNQSHSRPNVLNLFGYTGGASIACAKSGAFVTHVDASRPAISWAKENQVASGIDTDSIRWILDDVLGFVRREARRGKKYDAIIMDPPSFGHGAKGEVWKFHTHFPQLLDACREILSDTPLFVIVNAYAVSVSSLLLHTMLKESIGSRGITTCGELGIQQKDSERILSTGIYGRWALL